MSYIRNICLVLVYVCFASALDVRLGNIGESKDAYWAIQSALDKVAAAGGGSVSLEKGVYTLSRNIVIQGNTELRGAGMNATVMKLGDWAQSWKLAGFVRSSFKYDYGCDNIVIRGLTLDGNKNKQQMGTYGHYGIYTEACRNVLFDKVAVRNFQEYGFDPHGYKKTMQWSVELKIIGCVAHSNGWDGFTIDQSDGVYFANNLAFNNGRHGINVVTGSKNVRIVNSTVQNNGHYYVAGSGGCGIAIQNNKEFGTRDIWISGCVVDGDKRGGICMKDVGELVIKANVISNQVRCIDVVNCNDVVMTKNKCNSGEFVRINNSTNVVY